MEEQITEDQISELCMFMRTIELMKQNPQILDNDDIKEGYNALCSKVDDIMKLLTPKQLDIVLETHKIQLQVIEEELKKQAEE